MRTSVADVELRPQRIEGCHVVALETIGDERGFFARVFSAEEFAEAGLEPSIAQMNLARSEVAGTVRGIHWQSGLHAEAKLIRCIEGSVYSVCVDVREGSDTWGEWFGVELTAENRLALYIPPGCGHGYQVLESPSELFYSTSEPYAPGAEMGARWDDPAFGIRWPITDDVLLSEKDRSWPDILNS
jgi:dTDP-4-dehydrorhamnose 3,5-epimerase